MALAIDATTAQDSSGYVNSLTFSHTCSGTDRGLVVFVYCRTGSAEVTGVTYNGVAMTKEATSENSNVCGVTAWSLINPASGANNVVVSLSQYRLLSASATSFTGADQTYLIEAVTEATTGFSDAPSTSITTLTNNAIVIDGINLQNTRTVTVGSGQTEQANQDHSDANLGQLVSSTEPKTTAGSVTMSHSWTSGDNWAHVLLAVKESGGSPPTSTFIPKIILIN